VTSAPAGLSCAAACDTTATEFVDGTSVTLTAAAATGSRFTGWSGACSGTSACTVSMSAARNVTATFAATYQLTVTKAGTGSGTVTSAPAGISCGATCAAGYDSGTSVTLTAAATGGATFTGWSGGGCSGTATCTVSMTAATAITATFTTPIVTHDLTVTAWDGSGTGTVSVADTSLSCSSQCHYTGNHGIAVTLTAVPTPGSRFAGWSGGGCGGTGACTFTLNADTNVNAVFVAVSTLSVTKAGSGGGAVTSAPGGISCGATCSASFDDGSAITLTATPVAGSVFTGWSGGGCSGTAPCVTTLMGSTAVTATFTARPTLTVAKGGTGAGTVSSSPAGISCGATCALLVDPGAVLSLTAGPASGSTFTGWSGAGCTGTGPCQVTVAASTTVTATFAADPPPPVDTTPTTPDPGPTPPSDRPPSAGGTKPRVPNTTLLKAKLSKRTATFTFKAVGTATGFRCALTPRGAKKIAYKTCRSPVTFKKLKPGKYTFRVRAVNSAGADKTPASKSVTIKR